MTEDAATFEYPEYADAGDICRRLGLRIRDSGALSSALDRPAQVVWGLEAYEGLHLKAAALIDAITRSRPLHDGNKRLAFLLAAFFYAINGRSLTVEPGDGEAFIRKVGGVSHLPLNDIAGWLTERVRPRR